jgi:DNA-binding transcriptional MerR regulator
MRPDAVVLDSVPREDSIMATVDDLIPIGQFATLTWLSPKALRLYQDQGLLEPAHVDSDSGYRYYSISQISVASRISLLRRAGISLVEIGTFLANPTAEQIRAWRDALDAEVAQRRRMLEHISSINTTMEEAIMTQATSTTLRQAIPVLASLDLEATQRFYADRLGFDPLFTYPDYAIADRDGIRLHFWLTDDADIPKSTSCRIEVTGIDALYEELTATEVVHPNGPLTAQPWGMKEFAVLDGDGNLIKFSEPTPSGD